MTDQQRTIQHFPKNWVKENLPNYHFFQQHGVHYKHNICNTTPCGPSRASLFSGLYPATNGITDNTGTLPPEDLNFVNVLRSAGYEIHYKGKFHMNDDFTQFSTSWGGHPASVPEVAKSEDRTMYEKYKINGWTSPDFGTSLVNSPPTPADAGTMAAGSGHNDQRVVTGEYASYPKQESALEFLKRVQTKPLDNPFCLVVSLLNPHDVSLYPNGWMDGGYSTALFEHFQGFELPKSYYLDDLSTKPQCQPAYLNTGCLGKLVGTEAMNYVKFYAYLHTLSDRLHQQVFDAIGEELMNNSVLVRMADHGEMGMAHGGLQEKMFTAYNETQRVPLFFYNPLFEAGEREQLTGLIDIVPTLGGIARADLSNFPQLQGLDFSQTLYKDGKKKPTQDALLFNYTSSAPPPGAGSGSDNDSSDSTGSAASLHTIKPVLSPYAPAGVNPADLPSNISSIRTGNGWKYSVYYLLDTENKVEWGTAQFELYNLGKDDNEITNLLPFGKQAESEAIRMQIKLHKRLTKLMNEKGVTPDGWEGYEPPVVQEVALEEANK